MAKSSFYTSGPIGGQVNPDMNRTLDPNKPENLPVVSTDLDSVRTYQFEVLFDLGNVSDTAGTVIYERQLTLAAKQVTGLSYAFKDIEVHRMNDLVYYPGKIQQEEVTVTFDNLLELSPGRQFYEYLATVFDMRTGFYRSTTLQNAGKASMEILEFDGAGNIRNRIQLVGVYPKSFTKGEKNYSTSEFDTFEVKFRYDFMNIVSAAGN